MHQQHAEAGFQLLETGREGGLGDAAGFRGAAEMLFPREGDEKFQLVDQPAPTWRSQSVRL
jgi:hypothetical protein